MPVALSFLLSIIVTLSVACSSDASVDLSEVKRIAIAKSACNTLQSVGYNHSTFTEMVWLYNEYWPTHTMKVDGAPDVEVRPGGRDRPEFRNKDMVNAAEAIHSLHPGPISKRNFCQQIRRR